MSSIQIDNVDLEQLVLQENISSAVCLTGSQIQIGIKGDPSLRETAMNRCRYESDIDRLFDKIEPVFEELLLRRGIYRLFIGFNNDEVRTCSVFDPMREEIHEASSLASPEYVERHFPKIPYNVKSDSIHKLYTALIDSELHSYLPEHLQNLAQHRHAKWQAMSESDVSKVIATLKVMRDLPEYYLRNVSISTVQSVVRLQFNCDGTQVVHAKDFENFIQVNMP